MKDLYREIRAIVEETPVIDVHSHLGADGQRQARGLADILSYHWLHNELARAGAEGTPAEARENPEGYLAKVAPFCAHIRNTSTHYALMHMLHDLHGFEARTITPDNWRAADAAVRATANDTAWLGKVLDKGRIRRLTVAVRDGIPDSSERFIPYDYAEPMFAPVTRGHLVRLVGKDEPPPRTAAHFRELIEARVADLRQKQNVRALHVWIRDTWSYQRCDERDAGDYLGRLVMGRGLSADEEDQLIGFGADVLAAAAGRHGMTMQLFHGMQPYIPDQPRNHASFWNPDYLRRLAKFVAGHPETQFDIFLGTRLPGHEAASIARLSRNLAVSGAWWHGFTPATLESFFRDRLELLPHTAWNAYYSDGYIVEWVYAKLRVTRDCLARVLACQVEAGLLSLDDVPEIARNLLHDNALRLYHL